MTTIDDLAANDSDPLTDPVAPPVPAESNAPAPAAWDRRGARRVWWLGLLVFFALPAAWAFASPYNGSYDENAHIVRAAGIVRGQILVPPAHVTDDDQKRDGGFQRVPASLIPPNVSCVALRKEPATCLGTPPTDRSLREVHTQAARYNPFYYLAVGWPLLPLPDMAGVILTRLVSALLCAALLASALVTIWTMRRHRLMLLALLLATSPMLISLNGLVNPSGIEIDAAILLWVALLRLLSQGTVGPADPLEHRRLVRRCLVAVVIMVLARSEGGVASAAIVLFAMVATANWPAVRAALRRRDVRWGAVVVVGAIVVSGGWLMISQVADVDSSRPITSDPLSTVVRTIVLGNFDFWTRQTVGVFGYGTIGLPMWLYVTWGMVQGLLVLAGFAMAGRRRFAYTIVAIPIVCYLVGFVADMVMVRVIAYWMQGRYFLPLWVGIFFLAGLAVLTDRLPTRALRRMWATGFLVWAMAHLMSLATVLLRFRSGDGRSAYPTWAPMVGTATPVLVVVAGVVGAGALVYAYLRPVGTSSPGRVAVAPARATS